MSDIVPIDVNAAEKARAKARLVRAFKVAFSTPEGQAALEYLLEKFPPDMPRFGAHTHWNPVPAAVLDGQSQVTATIIDFLNQPAADDATAKPKEEPTNIT